MMKSLKKIFLGLLLISTLILWNCSDDDDDAKSAADKQIEMVTGRWKATSVSSGGVADTAFEDFALTISVVPGKQKLTYVITENPYKSPWTSVTTGHFLIDEDEPQSTLIREDGITINYTVTEQELSMSFNYSSTSSGGRVKGVEGDWEFVFERE
jgi:hypothetical protein